MSTPADNDPNNGAGSGAGGSLENNGTPPSTTGNGEGDWKAKAEEYKRQNDIIVQERNLLRSKVTEVEKQRDDALQGKETAVSELSKFKSEQAQAEKTRAAETKQSELLSKVSEKTRELAKDLGLSLSDAENEEEVKAFEAKLQKLNTTTGTDPNESTNNTPPPPPMNGNNNRAEAPAATTGNQTGQQSVEALKARVADIKF